MVVTHAGARIAATPPANMELQPIASSSADALPVTKQFVFHSRTARSVSLVGDFNRWNPDNARLTRAADGDLWSVTLPILPGRHLYAFMVDDSVFTLDPREPAGRDADLGVDASVIIVGKP
jgi:1,4-alpha-glucan branching enzyme